MRQWRNATQAWLTRHRALIGRFVFELVIVFVGVTAAFALEATRQQADEDAYRNRMIAALVPTLEDLIRHNDAFDQEVGGKLARFDAAIARHEQPPLPIFRETNSERPPTRAWDGIVSTGAAKALKPELFFQLSLFYTRQDSFGERYLRYNDFTEQRVFTLGPDSAVAYDPVTGDLRPEFAAYVDRLRDLRVVSGNLTTEAREIRTELIKLD